MGQEGNLILDEIDCPFCAERIKAKAVLCKHCKSTLVASTNTSSPPVQEIKQKVTKAAVSVTLATECLQEKRFQRDFEAAQQLASSGQLPQAASRYRKIIDEYGAQSTDDPVSVAFVQGALLGYASILKFDNKLEDAEVWAKTAVALCEHHANWSGTVRALATLAEIYRRAGRTDNANKALKSAREIAALHSVDATGLNEAESDHRIAAKPSTVSDESAICTTVLVVILGLLGFFIYRIANNQVDPQTIDQIKRLGELVNSGGCGALAGLALPVLFWLLIYFIPTGVAILCANRNWLAILLLNLFFGWTFIGWVVALICAVRK